MSEDASKVSKHCCMIIRLKAANNILCKPFFKLSQEDLQVSSNTKMIKQEFRVDKILTKLKVLEGIVKEELLLSDELKWKEAYD